MNPMVLRFAQSQGIPLNNSGGGGIQVGGQASSSGGIRMYDPFEDELRKRMALAKQQGWSDEEINRSATIERALLNKRKQQNEIDAQQKKVQEAQETAKKKPSTLKRALVNVGAIGAETLAGIASVAAAPVTGGASLAGGFAAGAGIESLRRKMLNEDQSLGASALEGGLTILPGIGMAKNLVKGGKVIDQGAKITKTANAVNNTRKIAQEAPEVISNVAPGVTSSIADAGSAGKRITQIDRQIALANRSGGLNSDEARRLMQEKKALTENFTNKPAGEAESAINRTAEIAPDLITKKGKVREATDNFGDFFKKNDEGFLNRKGTLMRGQQRGIIPGAKAGEKELGYDEALRVNSTVDDVLKSSGEELGEKLSTRFTPKSSREQFRIIENERGKVGQEIRDAIARDNVLIDNPRKTQIGQNIQDRIGKVADFDPNKQEHVRLFNNFARQIDNAKDVEELEQVRKNFDKIAKNTFKAGARDSTGDFKGRVAEAFRDGIDNFVTEASPVSKEIKGKYRDLLTAERFMGKRSNPTGIKFLGTTFNERGIGGGAVQSIGEQGGKLLQASSRILSPQAAKEFAKQFGLRAVVGTNSTSLDQPLNSEQMQALETAGTQIPEVGPAIGSPQSDEDQLINELIAGGAGDFDSISQGLAQYQDLKSGNFDPFSQLGGEDPTKAANPTGLSMTSAQLFDQAVQAYQRGDAKASDQFLQLAEFAKQAEDTAAKSADKKGGNGLNVTKVTSQQYGLAKGGMESVAQLEELIKSNPNLVLKSAAPGGSLPVVGGFIRNAAGVGNYDALAYNIADNLIRLRTGATANESEIKGYANKIMPRAGDSPDVVKTKLNTLKQSFNQIISLANQGGSGSSFEDELQDLFGSSYQNQVGY